FNGNFIEGTTQEYNFRDNIALQAVRLLVQWLYSQSLSPHLQQLKEDFGANISNEEGRQICAQEDLALAQLWVLADMLQIPELQNHVMQMMQDIAMERDCAPASSTYEYVYSNTAPESV